jgi:hypothetical protein
VAVRWRRPGGEWEDGGATPLERPLRPGRRRRLAVPLVAPWEPGRWELRVSVLQDGVAWLDDADLSAGVHAEVDVTR